MMKKKSRILSIGLALFLFISHFTAITSQAAPLSGKDADTVLNAIQQTEQLKPHAKRDYFTTLSDGQTKLVKSMAITNLSRPTNGTLLDETATVVTDSGVSWDIPVIWVNKDGDIIHLAIEIDDIVRSYPVFVFYIPEGYYLVSGENKGYDIQMPDFVVDLMKTNGVTTLSIPEGGVTYVSALLPEMDGLKVNTDSQTDPQGDDNSKETSSSGKDEKQKDTNPVKDEETNPEPVDPGTQKVELTQPTDNDIMSTNTELSDDAKEQLVEAHCDQNAMSILGTDKLAALVSWVKNTLEPEATNLLLSKFPAFKNASENGELGKNLGLYVFYNTYEDNEGKTVDKTGTLASVESVSNSKGDLKYRLIVNAGSFYEKDKKTGEYEFNGKEAYSNLDNTLVHEMMHAYMFDYTRTGMDGWEYDTSDGTYDLAFEDDLKYPKWFSEGTASTVENTFQYWNDEYYQIYNDGQKSLFTEKTLKSSYKDNSGYNLNGEEKESDYITGYLACLYLSYLRAKADNKDAISGSLKSKDLRVDSKVIRQGLNSILEDLHKGKTLDQVISNISKVDGKPLYKNTKDFESKFIINSSKKDESAKFCTDVLNYLHKSSSKKNAANGSVLIDFSDTNTTQLSKSQLKDGQKAYAMTDDKDYASSTVSKKKSLKSGGTSGTGITNTKDRNFVEKISSEVSDTEQAAKISNSKSAEDNKNNNDNSDSESAEAKDEQCMSLKELFCQAVGSGADDANDNNETAVKPETNEANSDIDSKLEENVSAEENVAPDQSQPSIEVPLSDEETEQTEHDSASNSEMDDNEENAELEKADDSDEVSETDETIIENDSTQVEEVSDSSKNTEFGKDKAKGETKDSETESDSEDGEANDLTVNEPEENIDQSEIPETDEFTEPAKEITAENDAVTTDVQSETNVEQNDVTSEEKQEDGGDVQDEVISDEGQGESDSIQNEMPQSEADDSQPADAGAETNELVQDSGPEVISVEEESEDHVDNPIIISETEEPEQDSSEDESQNQVLDAIPEDDSGEDGTDVEETSD